MGKCRNTICDNNPSSGSIYCDSCRAHAEQISYVISGNDGNNSQQNIHQSFVNFDLSNLDAHSDRELGAGTIQRNFRHYADRNLRGPIEFEIEARQGTLVFSSECGGYLMAKLIDFCRSRYIPYKKIVTEQEGMWLRDNFFVTQKNHSKQIHLRDKNEFFSEERISFNSECNPAWYQDGSEYPLYKGKFTHFDKCFDGVVSTSSPLEGGNLFDVKNTKGERCIIIGDQVIRYECSILERNGKSPNIRVIVESYAGLFGVGIDQILVLPNIIYHLDLQMAYIGNGVFILHDYKQEKERWGSPIPDELIAFYEPAMLQIEKLLNRNNFKSERFGACSRKTVEGSKVNKDVLWEGSTENFPYTSMFINGLYIESRGHRYFITHDTENHNMKHVFLCLLQKHGVRPYYVSLEPDIQSSLNRLSRFRGFVRCLTNFV